MRTRPKSAQMDVLREFVALHYERHPESVRTVPWLRPAGRDSGSGHVRPIRPIRGRVPICRIFSNFRPLTGFSWFSFLQAFQNTLRWPSEIFEFFRDFNLPNIEDRFDCFFRFFFLRMALPSPFSRPWPRRCIPALTPAMAPTPTPAPASFRAFPASIYSLTPDQPPPRPTTKIRFNDYHYRRRESMSTKRKLGTSVFGD